MGRARRRLGASEIELPPLGLGTAPLGGWPEAVYREDGTATVRRAWDGGLRMFDTAPYYGYGQAERFLGEVLRNVTRDEFILSTKVGRLLRPGSQTDPFFKGADPLSPVLDYSQDGVRRSLDESRERLGLERIDIALIHDPDDHHAEALEGAYVALAEMRDHGSLGAIGVGMNWSEPLARFAHEAEFDCFLLAGRYTLLEQNSIDDLLPAVTERGMSIIAGGVYNSGLLADPRPGANYNYATAPSELVERALRIKSVCTSFDVPLRAAAIQFPLGHPSVACVLVGARTPAEVEDNLRMFDVEVPGALWDALKNQQLLRSDAPVPVA
ncbi:MAG: aldo/keto reductase [Actinomycetota bacterium]